jgi:hypothetical protein
MAIRPPPGAWSQGPPKARPLAEPPCGEIAGLISGWAQSVPFALLSCDKAWQSEVMVDSWIILARNAALSAHTMILEDNPELPKVPAHTLKKEARCLRICTQKSARLYKTRGYTKEGHEAWVRFGDVTRSCRHCFEGSSGGANVITILWQFILNCGELRIREDRLARLPRLRRGLWCCQPPLWGLTM